MHFWCSRRRGMDVPGPSGLPLPLVNLLNAAAMANAAVQQSAAQQPVAFPDNLCVPKPLIRSTLSAFKEVHELRTQVNLLFPALFNGTTTSPASNMGPVVTPQAAALTSLANSLRKRPAPAPSHPEGPVSMRQALNACQPLPNSFMPYQWLLPVRAPSPLSAAALPTTEVTEAAPPTETAEQKWSSPSSVESIAQKTDNSTGETANIDIVGDGSESSNSSTSTQLVSPAVQHMAQMYNAAATAVVVSVSESLHQKPNYFFPTKQQQENAIRVAQQIPTIAMSATTQTPAPTERKHRKPVNDDIVKIIRQHDLSPSSIAEIAIPVPKALESFRPVSEQQIIQQIVQGKKYEETEVGECMIQLCKKLAEKRVFGPRLMSQTTVAGLNHSNYSNLPIKGICYIQHVCRQVLGTKITSDEDFWDKFREAMRKLAARCRRVRHAKKTKNSREESLLATQELSKRFGEEIATTASFTHAIQSLSIPTNGMRPVKADTSENVDGAYEMSQMPSITDLILRYNEKLQKPLKMIGEQEANAMTTLLNMANCGQQSAFKIETEPLSP